MSCSLRKFSHQAELLCLKIFQCGGAVLVYTLIRMF
jgi:hypothetical protein